MNATMPTGPHDHRAGEPTETHRHLGPVGTVAGAALHAARRSAGASESALAAEPGVVRVAVVDLGGPTERAWSPSVRPVEPRAKTGEACTPWPAWRSSGTGNSPAVGGGAGGSWPTTPRCERPADPPAAAPPYRGERIDRT